MKTIQLIIAGLALVACAACSSDFCSKSVAASKSYASKLAACYPDGGLTVTSCSDQTACEKNLGSCSSQDQLVLQNGVDCFNAYTGGCSLSAMEAVGGCEADAGTLSAACQQAFATNQGSCGADGG